jgi:putative nucleotidyltransferase with HDIG domain
MLEINTVEAFRIVEEIFYENRSRFHGLDKLLSHSYSTGEICKEFAPLFNLDPVELAVAGYFHDIGRCFTKDTNNHIFHEIVGANYFENNAISLGITNTQEEAANIAQYFRSHFVVYEQFTMPEFQQWLQELEEIDSSNLKPKSSAEMLVTYSDLININGNRVSFKQRIEDMKTKDEVSSNPRLKAIDRAEKRLYALRDSIEIIIHQ